MHVKMSESIFFPQTQFSFLQESLPLIEVISIERAATSRRQQIAALCLHNVLDDKGIMLSV